MPSTGLADASGVAVAGPASNSVSGFMVERDYLSRNELFLDPVVALGFELKGKGFVSALHDAAVPHNVDEIRDDIVEEALIMGDHDDTQFVAAQGVHAF